MNPLEVIALIFIAVALGFLSFYVLLWFMFRFFGERLEYGKVPPED